MIRDSSGAPKSAALQWNPLACRAYGLCAEELPEGIYLDEWGYPVLADGPIPARLRRRARAAAAACPVLALRVVINR